MTPREQAETILAQLGGRQFRVMTGAKYFAHDDAGTLTFKLPRTPGTAINHVGIELNGLDLYDIEFRAISLRRGSVSNKLVSRNENIYADMLRGIFERETGLRTSLTAVYS